MSYKETEGGGGGKGERFGILHNEELCSLYRTRNIFRVMNCRWMRGLGIYVGLGKNKWNPNEGSSRKSLKMPVTVK